MSNKSRDRSLSKDCFFELSTLKCFPEIPPVCFWRPLGALLGYLGRSWATLGALLGALGTLLRALGALLGRSWDALGALLGRSSALLGALGRLLDHPRRSWLDFGASEDRFWSLRRSVWQLPGIDLEPSSARVTTTRRHRNVESAWQVRCNTARPLLAILASCEVLGSSLNDLATHALSIFLALLMANYH